MLIVDCLIGQEEIGENFLLLKIVLLNITFAVLNWGCSSLG